MTHVTPLDPPLGLKKFWQDLAWSAEPDRGGKGSVKECRARLGMDCRCTGQGKAGLGRTWLGRKGLVLVYQQNRGSQDRHRPVLRIGVGVCGILRYKMPVPPLPSPARLCPFLP